ncbi:hypothetical protein MHH70_04085 [Metasolibacillus sp. FSL H7-0170]|uniref:hypothetical protein n=1 Tax=Metasolibacillus sp. FSL H7-0170 TaxID=2921431 RepID=UPI003158EC58
MRESMDNVGRALRGNEPQLAMAGANGAKVGTVKGSDSIVRMSKGESVGSGGTSKGTGKFVKFKGDEAIIHYEKHSKEIMDAMGKSKYNLKTYLEDANHVIQTGQYVPEMNGYVKIVGGKGSAKYGFVGLDRNTGNITTFHIKSVKELSKKAPSLGIETRK